ncbi:predicted protein [Sclerotinia sclerotiorum 1980 UF-70]|uniref:Uncharacterized protein n=1 Tax=Sclerotinia sclerotiorum (strain ATCC 18683 / 1980 / Ss-1) TaxID=665079 RepID=A7EH48_SCLS1|nr:predicted protein [Sclerotinia sclerotiorum 1980 UF-70]EDO02164.1 predicted protein [Sclerotinia sclerotiorum 1980 UF-70]
MTLIIPIPCTCEPSGREIPYQNAVVEIAISGLNLWGSQTGKFACYHDVVSWFDVDCSKLDEYFEDL